MKVQVLLSCMYQKDHSIIERSNIQTDIVVVNQCDQEKYEIFSFINKYNNICKAIFISTKERGLSKSRNMALKHATGDICIICDDDEILYDNYEIIIRNAYLTHNIDFAAFKIKKKNKIYLSKEVNITKKIALSISSYQISFKLQKILLLNIRFNENFGSGVSKAGGEENLFLFDCIKQKLKGRYFPIYFGDMIDSPSQWWNGYSKEYFYDHAFLSKELWGSVLGLCYMLYTLLTKYNRYSKNISFYTAVRSYYQGYISSFKKLKQSKNNSLE